MSNKLFFALAGLAVISGACSDSAPPASHTETISPQDFALVPCGPGKPETPCVLAVAGGKRILFGAPSGTAASLPMDELRQLDAVIVFSLRAVDIEGLDEIRNQSWQVGRDAPLLTIGPRGILDVVDGLNKAYEHADALRIVEEGIPRGGYDAAILTGREATRTHTVFDTGDVQVVRLSGGYQLSYNASTNAVFVPCSGDNDQALSVAPEEQTRIICDGVAPDLSWPLKAPHFVVKNLAPE